MSLAPARAGDHISFIAKEGAKSARLSSLYFPAFPFPLFRLRFTLSPLPDPCCQPCALPLSPFFYEVWDVVDYVELLLLRLRISDLTEVETPPDDLPLPREILDPSLVNPPDDYMVKRAWCSQPRLPGHCLCHSCTDSLVGKRTIVST
jgi:hypothetical protein